MSWLRKYKELYIHEYTLIKQYIWDSEGLVLSKTSQTYIQICTRRQTSLSLRLANFACIVFTLFQDLLECGAKGLDCGAWWSMIWDWIQVWNSLIIEVWVSLNSWDDWEKPVWLNNGRWVRVAWLGRHCLHMHITWHRCVSLKLMSVILYMA